MLLPVGCIAPVAASDALPGPRVFGWGFNEPDSVYSNGTRVWVANYGDSVTQLNAATGGQGHELAGAKYGFLD
jgi:hypothetical protein